MKFWQSLVLAWLPAAIGYGYGAGTSFADAGLLGTILLYGVILAAIHEEVFDDE